MTTPEDEVFDEIAKRQGDWGGGYQAKKAMAADKLRDCVHGSLARSCQICDLAAEVEELKAALAQPAQELLSDDSIFDIANKYLYNGGKSYGVLEFARAIEAAHGIKEENT